MRRKFGDLYDWDVPQLVQTVGPFTPEVFDDYAKRIDLLLAETFKVLSTVNGDEIHAIYADDPREETGVCKQWRDLFADEIKILKRDSPFWAAGGFGHPDYVTDFEYWGRMPSFLLFEAVSLTLGIDPEIIEPLLNEDDEVLKLLGQPLVFAKKRAVQIHRQFRLLGSLNKITSVDLLKWIKAVELETHPQALDVLERFHGEGETQNVTFRKEDPRAVRAVAKIITAIAIEEYGYDPKAKRSPIPNEIVGIMDRLGLEGTSETVHKYLKIGAEDLPDGWNRNDN